MGESGLSFPNETGGDLPTLGFTGMSILALSVNLRLLLEAHNVTWIEAGAYMLMLMALILTMLMVSYTYSVVGVFSCTSLPQLNWCSYYGIMPKLWPQGTYWLTVTLSVLVVLFPRFLKKALNSSVEVSPAQQAIAAAKKHAKELAVADRQRSLRRLRTSRLHLGTARLSSMGRLMGRGSSDKDKGGYTTPRDDDDTTQGVTLRDAKGVISKPGSRANLMKKQSTADGLKETSFNFDVHEKSAKFIFGQSQKATARWSLDDYVPVEKADALLVREGSDVSYTEQRFHESI